MGDSRDRKRSKKSKRAKRAKKEKQARRARRAAREAASEQRGDDGLDLSADSQAVVIEMQKTELSRLLREQHRLNERVDQLLRLHEREQVLRQQMQTALDKLAAQRALPPPDTAGDERLVERVNRAEGKFTALQSAVGLLVAAIERQSAGAR